MKKYLLAAALLCVFGAADAQTIDTSYANSYYVHRLDYFRKMPDQKNEIVFLGNSLTEAGEWQELFPGKNVVNRGISGDVTFGIYARLDEVVSSKPEKIFLLSGVNDIKRGISTDIIAASFTRILDYIHEHSPKTKVYLESTFPVNEGMLSAAYNKVKNSLVLELNAKLKVIAPAHNATFIDLHPLLTDENGQLKKALTTDGIHIWPEAYIVWANFLKDKKYL
ncbi:MAG: GDSL family lipase [Filimonas sp.]|nr:GDSL family lipase [Filimonas sp.]